MDYESYLELEETTLINLGFLKVAEKMSFMDLQKDFHKGVLGTLQDFLFICYFLDKMK